MRCRRVPNGHCDVCFTPESGSQVGYLECLTLTDPTRTLALLRLLRANGGGARLQLFGFVGPVGRRVALTLIERETISRGASTWAKARLLWKYWAFVFSSYLFSVFVFPLDQAGPFSVVPSCLCLFSPYHPYLFSLFGSGFPRWLLPIANTGSTMGIGPRTRP